HQITGVLRVRAKYGVTGKGVKVGIIDSGLDWKHPALGAGTSFPTERVPFGYDFVGDDFKSGGEPVPGIFLVCCFFSPFSIWFLSDDDPMDCGGHGTHVAGIIGANSTATYIFTGVAPEVTFGAYRVFGCDGATDTAVILQAIQRAFSDGMEVINMSLGSDGGFGVNDPEVDLINAISATGKVIFAIAQGNAQSGGVWQSSAPALAERATSVAATNNLATLRTRSFTVAGKRFNMTVYDNARVPTNPLDIILNVNAAPAPGASANTDACTGTAQLPGTITNPTGKVLLIRRGTCGFLEKAQNAQAAGAAAVIIYNRTSDAATKVTIPVYAMDETSGSALAVLLLSQPTLSSKFEVDAADAEVSVPQITITSFSSWGPPPDLRFKPDVAAPGSNILSTLPLAQGGFGFESGTSMATPYVSSTFLPF
ncbi:peptidase S8/S53 domain-containing protein, partial [Cladochytrium replicatum]